MFFSFKPSHTISHHLSKIHIKTEPYSCSLAQLCLLDTKDVAQNRQEVLWFNRKSPLFQQSSTLVPPWACWRGLQRHKTYRRKTELLKHFPLSRFAVKVHLGTNPHFSLRIIQAWSSKLPQFLIEHPSEHKFMLLITLKMLYQLSLTW